MQKFLRRTWAEINLDHLVHNISVLRERAAGKELMAIVKADAYGHGDHIIARELNRLGVTFFGVSNLEEATCLRNAGVKGEILILGITPAEYAATLAEQSITQAVFSTEYGVALSRAATAAGVRVKSHLKIDTGMGRIGFVAQPDADPFDEILAVTRLPGLEITGIFSHFSVADLIDPDADRYTDQQQQQFQQLVDRLGQAGVKLPYIHLQNSAGIIRRDIASCNLVRIGISMYGLSPADGLADALPVKPLMTLKTAVAMIKEIPAGRYISYGRTFCSDRLMRVATVPVGYADGYPRALSSKAVMLIHGKPAPVLGCVCMDQLVLDVTDIPEVTVGDEVTVFGRSGEATLSAEQLAAQCGTIGYEIVCSISRRVPRVYLRNGEAVETVDYLLSFHPE